MDRFILLELKNYKEYLFECELSEKTIEKYLTDIKQWLYYTANEINKETLADYKKYLLNKYEITTANSKLISINKFLRWLGKDYITVKLQKVQKSRCLEYVISKDDYKKMLSFAKNSGRIKMYYLMKTIAMTGIRIGELRFITVDAIESGYAKVLNKGKYREVFLSESLCDELKDYCEMKKISTGIIFYGRECNKAILPSTVWHNLKYIAKKVGIDEKKVYPHSFRHLFAKLYMESIGDLTELSDILGHSSLETTSIYTRTSIAEKREKLEKMYF